MKQRENFQHLPDLRCKSLKLTLQAVAFGQYLSDITKLYLEEYQFHRRTFLWNYGLAKERGEMIIPTGMYPNRGLNGSSFTWAF